PPAVPYPLPVRMRRMLAHRCSGRVDPLNPSVVVATACSQTAWGGGRMTGGQISARATAHHRRRKPPTARARSPRERAAAERWKRLRVELSELRRVPEPRSVGPVRGRTAVFMALALRWLRECGAGRIRLRGRPLPGGASRRG